MFFKDPARWFGMMMIVVVVGCTGENRDGARPNHLIASPGAVTLNEASDTAITIRGGFTPYRIETRPDPAIAYAELNDNQLVIIGFTPGTDSVTIADHFGQRVVVSVVVAGKTEK